MNKKLSQKESGYFKKYYAEHKEYFKQRHKNGYHKKYREKNKNDIKKYINVNKIKYDDYQLKRYYNITLDQYNVLFNKQNGCCAICGIHQNNLKRKLHVDHNHESGEIRGLLCINCNLALGHVNDNINTLSKMISYLTKGIEALDLQKTNTN